MSAARLLHGIRQAIRRTSGSMRGCNLIRNPFMNSQYALKGCLVAAAVTVGTQFNWDSHVAAQQTSAAAVKGVEILTRGPVHEAFAETVTFDPQPGIVVPKAPPDAIEELPPDQKPEGENVAWIPGYWAWDDEREDFLWVSGIVVRPSSGPPMGARLLGPVRPGVSMDFRVLGRCQNG